MKQEHEYSFISVTDAARQLGVSRQTMHQYKKIFDIQWHKFKLDRHHYIRIEDVARIKEARDAAAARAHEGSEEELAVCN